MGNTNTARHYVPRSVMAERIRIEQAIARGQTFGDIADTLRVDLNRVLSVWAAMDEASRETA